jgi:hypothetical protein
LKPCIYIAASVVDLAVDVLRLVLDLVVCISGFAKGIVENVLSIAENRLARLLDILEDLCVGDDEGRCQRQEWYNAGETHVV